MRFDCHQYCTYIVSHCDVTVASPLRDRYSGTVCSQCYLAIPVPPDVQGVSVRLILYTQSVFTTSAGCLFLDLLSITAMVAVAAGTFCEITLPCITSLCKNASSCGAGRWQRLKRLPTSRWPHGRMPPLRPGRGAAGLARARRSLRVKP